MIRSKSCFAAVRCKVSASSCIKRGAAGASVRSASGWLEQGFHVRFYCHYLISALSAKRTDSRARGSGGRPATVEDSQGKLVTGLTEDNFETLEDGVRQRISNFSCTHTIMY